jgi:hypothetical protein
MVPIARAYLTARGAYRQFTAALLFIVDVFLVKSLNLMGVPLDIFGNWDALRFVCVPSGMATSPHFAK